MPSYLCILFSLYHIYPRQVLIKTKSKLVEFLCRNIIFDNENARRRYVHVCGKSKKSADTHRCALDLSKRFYVFWESRQFFAADGDKICATAYSVIFAAAAAGT